MRYLAAIGTLGLTLIADSAIAGSAIAGTPPSSSVAHNGQHDFDFDIGTWHSHIKRLVDPFASTSKTIDFDGTITVRKVWGGKAELEEIELDGPKSHWEGLTLLLYNPSAHQWSQYYANSQVGVLSPSSTTTGGLVNGRLVLVGQDSTTYDKTILVRAEWYDIKPDSHKYSESFSQDGGLTWVTAFVANLTRVKK